MSVRTKPASPGWTALTPILSFDKSVTKCRANIFSARVIGRCLVSIAGIATLPCSLATLKGNRPPYSMIWRVIAARALAPSLARHRYDEAPILDISALDWKLITALQTDVDEFPKRLVKVIADVGRRDLVSGDVVSERRYVVYVQVLALELRSNERRVFSKEKNAAFELNL